jgi:hypothetical protein
MFIDNLAFPKKHDPDASGVGTHNVLNCCVAVVLRHRGEE